MRRRTDNDRNAELPLGRLKINHLRFAEGDLDARFVGSGSRVLRFSQFNPFGGLTD
jgi:hypothetical protein